MDEAFSSCNNSEMGRIAHKLKSSARFIGALKLGELAEKIEKNAITGITDEFKELYGEFKDEFNSVDIELAEIKKENKI
jgi:HPt (histidine-containing phosphotransfer) domain-containing protein